METGLYFIYHIFVCMPTAVGTAYPAYKSDSINRHYSHSLNGIIQPTYPLYITLTYPMCYKTYNKR